MVQVLTVSAQTAAYAADAVKQPARAPRSKFIEDAMHVFKKDDADSEELYLHISSNVSDSTSSAINMRSRDQEAATATLKETIAAYETF